MTREEVIKMLEYVKHVGNGESEYKNDAQAIAIDMAIKDLEEIKALGEDMRIFQKGIKDEKVLIGFNMAVALCNKHLERGE